MSDYNNIKEMHREVFSMLDSCKVGGALNVAENMSLAVSCYHSFFEGETYSEEEASSAYMYYTRAMKRVKYIGYMLTGGEIPEEENVIIYEDTNDSNILHKWLSDDEEEDGTDAGENQEPEN